MHDNFIILLCFDFSTWVKNLIAVDYETRSLSMIDFTKYSHTHRAIQIDEDIDMFDVTKKINIELIL